MKTILSLLILFILTGSAAAQEHVDLRRKHFNLNAKNLAMQGYDPVSYFNSKEPKEGKSEFQYTYKGVVYFFVNTENRNKFMQNPSKYEPQYGGWCAYALGDSGEKVKIDPETYKILNGKLYLFYNFFFNNTLEDWNKDETNLKREADANWNKLINQ